MASILNQAAVPQTAARVQALQKAGVQGGTNTPEAAWAIFGNQATAAAPLQKQAGETDEQLRKRRGSTLLGTAMNNYDDAQSGTSPAASSAVQTSGDGFSSTWRPYQKQTLGS